MPNHCSNCWSVTGPEKEIIQFAKDWEAAYKDGNPFDVFCKIPEELANVATGSTVIDGKIYTRWTSGTLPSGKKAQVPITPEKDLEMLELYGATDWYSWAQHNWGTKWGGYSCKEPQLHYKDGKATIDLVFDSAWSPPRPAANKLMELHPNWTMETFCSEWGNNFFEVCDFADGELMDTEVYDMSEFEIDMEERIGISREDSPDSYWDIVCNLPPVERYTGIVKETFERFPEMHLGG